jgi:metacaspase-1
MVKKAFCVGINDYPIEGADLKGCVNDAGQWASLLRDHFDFPSADVRVMTDSEATKANMLSGLKDLLAGAGPGDVLVFTNSSHGSHIPDTSGDEPTYDEVLCPYDVRDNAVSDDELRELFSGLPTGVRLTVISDSCHSGTVTRALIIDNIPGLSMPDDRRVRFLSPALFRGGPVLPDPMGATPRTRMAYPQSSMDHVLLAGCKDSEYSYDAVIGGDYHGAMTYHAIKAIEDAKYEITYTELRDGLGPMLEQAGYQQHPQLEGESHAKHRQLFT